MNRHLTKYPGDNYLSRVILFYLIKENNGRFSRTALFVIVNWTKIMNTIIKVANTKMFAKDLLVILTSIRKYFVVFIRIVSYIVCKNIHLTVF